MNGSFELSGDTDLTSKYCTFIDWQQSHQTRQSSFNANKVRFVDSRACFTNGSSKT
jgi:hypothetical protein